MGELNREVIIANSTRKNATFGCALRGAWALFPHRPSDCRDAETETEEGWKLDGGSTCTTVCFMLEAKCGICAVVEAYRYRQWELQGRLSRASFSPSHHFVPLVCNGLHGFEMVMLTMTLSVLDSLCTCLLADVLDTTRVLAMPLTDASQPPDQLTAFRSSLTREGVGKGRPSFDSILLRVDCIKKTRWLASGTCVQ